jgi:hypothetical protein
MDTPGNQSLPEEIEVSETMTGRFVAIALSPILIAALIC